MKSYLHLLAVPLALVAALEPNLNLNPPQEIDQEVPFQPIPEPDKDLMDLKNIEPSKSLSMLWKNDERGSVSVSSQMKHPAVKLEEIGHIESVTCDTAANSLQIKFNDDKAFQTAKEKWPPQDEFILVTNALGSCDAQAERGFYIAQGVTADDGARSFSVKGKKTELKETAEETEISIDNVQPPQLSKRLEFEKKVEKTYDLERPLELFHAYNTSLVAESLHIDTGLTFSGKIKMSWFKVTDCWFDMSGNAALDLALKLQLEANFRKEISKSTGVVTMPILAIPGIIAVGPAVEAAVGVDLSAIASIYALAKVSLEFGDAKWHVDLVDGSKSENRNLVPKYNASVELGGSASLLVNPFLDLKFMLNAQILAGLANLNGGVRVQPKFANTFTVDARGEVISIGSGPDKGQGESPPPPEPEGGKSDNEDKEKGDGGPNALPEDDGRPPKEAPEEGGKSSHPGDDKEKGTKDPNALDGGKENRKSNTVRGLLLRDVPGKYTPLVEEDGEPISGKDSPKDGKEDPKSGKDKKEKKPPKTLAQTEADLKAKENRQQANQGGKNCPNGMSLKSEFQLNVYAFIFAWEKRIYQETWPMYDGCYKFPGGDKAQ